MGILTTSLFLSGFTSALCLFFKNVSDSSSLKEERRLLFKNLEISLLEKGSAEDQAAARVPVAGMVRFPGQPSRKRAGGRTVL